MLSHLVATAVILGIGVNAFSDVSRLPSHFIKLLFIYDIIFIPLIGKLYIGIFSVRRLVYGLMHGLFEWPTTRRSGNV